MFKRVRNISEGGGIIYKNNQKLYILLSNLLFFFSIAYINSDTLHTVYIDQ